MFFPPAGGKRAKAATAEVSSLSPPCSSAPSNSPLFYLKDSLSGRRFLVDTGAAASVFPHHSKSTPSAIRLTAANGDNIASWGSRSLPLKYGDKRFSWPILLAARGPSDPWGGFSPPSRSAGGCSGLRPSYSSTLLQWRSSTVPPPLAPSSLRSTPPSSLLLTRTGHCCASTWSSWGRGSPTSTPSMELNIPSRLRVRIRRSMSAWASPLHMVPNN